MAVVHAVLHIIEPEGSAWGNATQKHLCLSRTKVDSTAPLAPANTTRAVRCVPCNLLASRATPLGQLLYAPSTSEVEFVLEDSFAEPDDAGGVHFQSVQILTGPMGPASTDGAQCAALLEQVALPRGDAEYTFVGVSPETRQVLTEIVDLTSGLVPTGGLSWSPQRHTDARPEWKQPSILHTTAYYSLLTTHYYRSFSTRTGVSAWTGSAEGMSLLKYLPIILRCLGSPLLHSMR